MASIAEHLKYSPIELTGRLNTAIDPTQLGKGDLQQLTNMRYTNAPGIKGVQGMAKINATPVANPKIRAAYNFVKEQPAEQHLIVQGYDANNLNPTLYDNIVSAPSAATFNSLFVETAGAGAGRFSPAPNGCFAYANGLDTVLWSGAEDPVAGFVVTDTNDVTARPAILYDYTSEASDYTAVNYAVIKQRFIHIASTRKLKGIKFYVTTGNTTASTMKVYNWTTSGWTAVTTQVDGTATSGKTLNKTGWVTFDSTINTAIVRYFNNTIGYWYLIDTKDTGGPIDVGTQISYCTVDTPVQSITDLWDGVPRQLVAAFNWRADVNTGTFLDWTTQLYKKDYVANVLTTYASMAGYATTWYLVLGFTERMQGLYFDMVDINVNTGASTMAVKYWNGSAWASVNSLVDSTIVNGASLGRAGMVTWTPPSSTSEFQRTIVNQNLFCYYQISFTAQFPNNSIFLDNVTGVPVSKTIGSYKFPVMFQQRLGLCNETDQARNMISLSSINTNCVYNGTDSIDILVGDESDIIAATPFFSRFSNNFYENLLVLKKDSVWVVDGHDPSDYRVYNVANMYGGVAPLTLVTCDIGFAVSSGGGGGGGATRNVSIWQTANNIIMWDGSVLYPISLDIEDVFDQTKSYAIDLTMVSRSVGFYDESLREYHWLWASKNSTTLNNEYVFDLLKKKWFVIDRTSGLKLQLGIAVTDANNAKYSYGFIDTGYVERLEYGKTFDGQDIVSTFWTGDIPLNGWMEQVRVRNMKVITKSKNTTANKLQLSIYGDCSNSAIVTLPLSVSDASRRIRKDDTQSLGTSNNLGDYVFHSFKAVMTTNNEDVGFEPIGIGVLHKETRYDT